MSRLVPPYSPLWPLAIYFVVALYIALGMVLLSHFAGERRHHESVSPPYESGMIPTGSTQVRLSVSYYLVAMFFLIFDIEAAYLFAWAVSLRKTGWTAFIEIVIFISILIAGLIYLWRQGALNWGSRAGQSSVRHAESSNGTTHEIGAHQNL
jgi:NADH-quinone oxidoreductase subunit A